MRVTYESWLTNLVENLSEHFNLAGWVITIEYWKTEEFDDPDTYAQILVNSSYSHARIVYSDKAKQDWKIKNIDRIVMSTVHEIVHIFLDPFQDWLHPHLSIVTAPIFMTTLEQQTQKLTMVLLNSLPPEIIPPR